MKKYYIKENKKNKYLILLSDVLLHVYKLVGDKEAGILIINKTLN